MRIGIDYTSAMNQKAGIGRYTRSLVSALADVDNHNEYVMFYAGGRQEKNVDLFANHPNFHQRPVAVSDRVMSIVWHRLQLPLSMERLIGPVNLFHSPDYTLPPMKCRQRVLTVHDLSFLLYPECHERSLREYLETTVPRSVSRSSLVLADSLNTMNDLICLLDVEPERVVVVYPGVDEHFHRVPDEETLRATRKKYGLDFPFILYVGTIEPRKNLGRLLQAYARLKTKRQIDHKLVIGGGKGWLFDDVFSRTTDLRLENDVVLPGYIPDEDLPSLYRLADLFVFPSLYEGFGLPPLEAMACGTPVITSTKSSLPEIAGDAALMINPTDIDELASAIARVLDDSQLRQEMRQQGIDQASRFNWQATANQLLEIYERLGKAG